MDDSTKYRTRSLSSGLVDLGLKQESDRNLVYDVVIVGSGYGGSVAAQQLAGLQKDENGNVQPIKICVLERGSEYLPGMFPSAFADLPGHVRYGAQDTGKVTGELEGLFDIRLGPDVNALVANGLGGGSLINAGVMAKPKFDEFVKTNRMPQSLVNDLKKKYLGDALDLLITQPLKTGADKNTIEEHPCFSKVKPQYPLKFHRLSELGSENNLRHAAAEISVAMKNKVANEHSVNLNQCVSCGDCMTGCNVGAKASLDSNLLAQAGRDGVEIYTGASVLSLSRENENKCHQPNCNDDHSWTLEVVHTSTALRVRTVEPIKLKARKVILAAGTFGSTEILLRSRNDKLVFSNMLGERFSCNGDNIAAIHGLKEPAHCVADEHIALSERRVGPTITNIVEVPPNGDELGFLIQEFAVPAPLKRLFAEIVTTGNALAELPTAECTQHGFEHLDRPGRLDPCAIDYEAIDKTLLVGLIGHDESNGALRLPLQPVKNADGFVHASDAGMGTAQEGALQIVWPQARHGEQINAAHRRLKEYSEKAFEKSTVIANPMWQLLPEALADIVAQPRGPVMTVHPLGGCPIGADKTQGVVDQHGIVFNLGNTAEHNWEGSLVVLDGSIIPGSLGANPALTISAVALRAVEHLAAAWSFSNPNSLQIKKTVRDRPNFTKAMPGSTVKPVATTVAITERLSGPVMLHAGKMPPEEFIVEITLSYQDVVLQDLMSTWQGRVLKVKYNKSYLRIFKKIDWDAGPILRVADDDARERKAIFKASLEGSLKFFHREPTSVFRRLLSIFSYLNNRGLREIFQTIFRTERKVTPAPLKPPTLCSNLIGYKEKFVGAIRLATRAGEVRRFDYCLTVGDATIFAESELGASFANTLKGAVVKGEKRLTYNCRANPWRQMMELSLTQFPSMSKGIVPLLTLDTRFIAKQGIPLIQIVGQQNQANTLLDMASFGLFMTRVMLNIHLWTFKKPDASHDSAEPQRLPGAILGLPAPIVTELTVGLNVRGVNAVVRLTRYPRHDSALPSVAMIHGYSVSGTTFTHPSLKPSAAEYFWHQGRDVWVVDMRTSSGMQTATVPWSYDETALVDIPAALLHIKNATGNRVDVIAHCIGAAMLSMAILTEARKIPSSVIQLGVDTWITPEQLGTLAAFNGDGGKHALHPTINAIVLSQKGPLLRYTEANIFRAYMMRSLRRWLVPNGYQFRPPSDPKVADQLLDRLLASMPYPDEDYDVENPKCPWTRTAWTASRHRMDALYARDFNAANLSEETRNAIDDLFGPINLDTVAQTIHFVRFNCITNQAGRGEFVTLDNLKARWAGMPTFAIHGADNGLVDVSTQQLLEANFTAAGVPFAKETFTGFGHQDVFIGKNSSFIFEKLEKFLKAPKEFCDKNYVAPVPSPTIVNVGWRFDAPWIGPRLSVFTSKHGKLQHRIYALSSPKYGKSQLILMPVKTINSRYKRSGDLIFSKPEDSQNWLFVLSPLPTSCEPNEGWLAIIAYRYEETTLNSSDAVNINATDIHQTGPAQAPSASLKAGGGDTTFTHHQTESSNPILRSGNANHRFVIQGSAATVKPLDAEISTPSPELIDDLEKWLELPGNDAALGFISCSDFLKWTTESKKNFSFALGSCQYPAGIVDKPVAEQSMRVLADVSPSLDFVIFAGDQIYADATAGLVDPVRSDERYDLPYESALRSEPMRTIMRTVPVHMMLDDHEIVDNWEPPHPGKIDATKGTKKVREQGLKAYWNYQRLEPYPRDINRAVSYDFAHGGALVYMLDTRSQREFRPVGQPDSAVLFSSKEMYKLKIWLLVHKAALKFIVSPAIILPQHLGMLNINSIDQATRADAWEGYPAQLRKLFEYIVDNDIENTVFLSGDEHLSCVASAKLSKKGKSQKITSIHASGLYAPFPFANSRPEDFAGGLQHIDLQSVQCSVATTFAPLDTAFAKITVVNANLPGQTVAVDFIGKDGKINSFHII
jgi:cholesterol oxidase